ncbi:MAG TPA: hypothetical protein VK110_07065 [Salinisphaeraceae bacterium]|nr:hypothetical protein [Salinisphaeraceae bacterium]
MPQALRQACWQTTELAAAVEHGFDVLLDPTGAELKILIDLAGAG